MRETRAALLLCLVLFSASCAQPPQEQIASAREAISAAMRSVDVVTYAPGSLRTAQESMSLLDEELAAQARRSGLTRSFDTVREMAEKVLAEAQAAAADAAAAKDEVREATGPLIAAAGETAAEVEKRLWAARRVRGVKPDFLAARAEDIAQVRAMLADAQKDFDQGAFAAANAKAKAAGSTLETVDGRISEAVRLARR
jgi:hypothetical protein